VKNHWEPYFTNNPRITVTILDINHRSAFYLNVSETSFCLCLQLEPTQMGPIERVSLRLQNPVSERSCFEARAMDIVQNFDSYGSMLSGLENREHSCRDLSR
jgi:hypothetical protein